MFTLALTKNQFASLRPELEVALRRRLQEELASTVADRDAPELTGDIWGELPKVDSKIAFKATSALEGLLGKKVHPSLIKNGGYESIDQSVEHIISGLSERCSDLTTQSAS